MTFSIVARDRATNRIGAAVTTSSIAVGSRCPWTRARVGAVVTQNITDPALGIELLDLLETGVSAKGALDQVVQSSADIEYRQLTVIAFDGSKAHFTGQHILGVNAVLESEDCIAAGNLLAAESVVEAVVEAYACRNDDLHLAEALIGALQAGLAAGGEVGPLRSAAVAVARDCSWPEVDLRIDWDDAPLDGLFKLWKAYQPQADDYITRAVSPAQAPSFGVPGDE